VLLTAVANSLDVIRVVLVDGVIAQVHARVPQVFSRGVILDGGEPDKTLLVQVDDHRVIRGDCHVQPQVALVPVNQQRVVDVLGNDQTLLQRNLLRLLQAITRMAISMGNFYQMSNLLMPKKMKHSNYN
jgi:hypothetical protein